jgi:hypothetical protein
MDYEHVEFVIVGCVAVRGSVPLSGSPFLICSMVASLGASMKYEQSLLYPNSNLMEVAAAVGQVNLWWWTCTRCLQGCDPASAAANGVSEAQCIVEVGLGLSC